MPIYRCIHVSLMKKGSLPMKFAFEEIPTLPNLAWCIEVSREHAFVTVKHGAGVDRHSDFFYEGCWNGNLSATGLSDAYICAASGAVLKDDALLIVAPSNTMARLYAIRLVHKIWISNSMAFAVAASGQVIEPHYPFYQEDISSIIEGLDKAVKSIPLKDGAQIDLYCHCNILLTDEFKLIATGKKPCPVFSSFDEYRNFLSDSLKSVLANASSAKRSLQFKPLVSISKGYDSVTCASLAREAGCQDAFSIFDPESTEPDADNGADLAIHLGLNVTEVARTTYKELHNEYEFFCLGTGGEDAFFAPLEHILHGRVFISGFHGDKVWEKSITKISDQIVRGDPSGADLEEFRLRVGFIHLPIPFFGCRAHAAIVAISNSAEMLPWSLGGDYDRPICRRIAEEAGLARSGFGQKKRVMSRSFPDKGLGWYFGKESLQEFLEYASTHQLKQKYSHKMLHELSCMCGSLATTCGHFSYRLGKIIRQLSHPLDRYAHPFDMRRQLFYWAFQKMLGNYIAALKITPENMQKKSLQK